MLRALLRLRALACAVVFLVAGVGCGGKPIYPVRGQVLDPSGAPVTALKGGTVIFESVDGNVSANGTIEDEGRFTLTTEHTGDGAYMGRNRVAITRPHAGADRPNPAVIDPKYENMQTSGLEYDVQPKSNAVTFTVELYKGRKR